jgi:hypothetical protein
MKEQFETQTVSFKKTTTKPSTHDALRKVSDKQKSPGKTKPKTKNTKKALFKRGVIISSSKSKTYSTIDW